MEKKHSVDNTAGRGMPDRFMNTDLIIIGAGAGGLMAAATAGELGLRAMIVERKHLPGRKLLLCGNNRCNVTRVLSAADMLADLGEPVAGFVRTALERFDPAALRAWFEKRGLRTVVRTQQRVYPASEKADDVLHCFQDALREQRVPMLVNSAVERVERMDTGYCLHTVRCRLTARYVLIATGGVSYPKTGSVGDGQQFARSLGHRVEPYRAGLVGYEMDPGALRRWSEAELRCVAMRVFDAAGQARGDFTGDVAIERWGLGGTVMVNISRAAARAGWAPARVDVASGPSKHVTLSVGKPRPLKEAMVTIGGVRLDEVDAETMESRIAPGLFFAGEVLDIDGPTGGYNLQMAFSTARLAVETVAARCADRVVPSRSGKVPAQHDIKRRSHPFRRTTGRGNRYRG